MEVHQDRFDMISDACTGDHTCRDVLALSYDPEIARSGVTVPLATLANYSVYQQIFKKKLRVLSTFNL